MKCLLIYVSEKMKRFYSNVGTSETAFEKRPKILKAVGMHPTAHIFFGVVNHVMNKPVAQTVIADVLISEHRGAFLHVLEHLVLQCLAFYVWDNRGTYFTQIAVEHAHDNRFAVVRPGLLVTQTAVFVHVPDSTADVSLIYLNFLLTALRPAAEFRSPIVGVKDVPDALKHKPCRLLRNAKGACQFVGTDTVLAIDQHPYGGHPLIQAKGGILEYGADLNRRTFLATLT